MPPNKKAKIKKISASQRCYSGPTHLKKSDLVRSRSDAADRTGREFYFVIYITFVIKAYNQLKKIQ